MDTRDLDRQMAARIAALRSKMSLDEKPPEGWITSGQFAKHIKRSQRHAWAQLMDWAEHGLCEVKKYKVKTPQSYKYLPHYKLAPEVAEAYGLKQKKAK